MKAIRLILALLFCCPALPTGATPPTTVTATAVPVGVPIAQVAPTVYSYRAYAQQAAGVQLSEDQLDRLADKLAARLGGAKIQAAKQVDAKAFFATTCVRCHSGDNPKGGLSLEGDIEAIPKADRQESILRMLSQDPALRMPKGQQPLQFDQFETLLRHLML